MRLEPLFNWPCHDGFECWAECRPRENLRPVFEQSPESLTISGIGGKNFGWYAAPPVKVSADMYYRFTATFDVRDIDNVNIHVMNLLYWTDSGKPGQTGAHDAILSYVKNEDGSYTGSQVIKSPSNPGTDTAEIQLGARFLNGGSVTWRSVVLTEAEQPVRKPVRVAAVGWNPLNPGGPEASIRQMTERIDTAGRLGADIFLLPEFSNVWQDNDISNTPAEEIPSGRVSRLLSEKAREYHMNVCAGLQELDGGYLYNAGVLFDREGKFAGKYRKTHPYWPEEFFTGTLPGDEFPVFDLDFGRVGVMICFDSWYAETARLLTLKGAELILFPNAGYEQKLLPARCIDNNNYIAVSSMYHMSGIMNTTGDFMACAKQGVVYADVDLNARYCCHPNNGGSMNAGGAGRRTNMNSCSDKLYREIAGEVRKVEDRPWKHSW